MIRRRWPPRLWASRLLEPARRAVLRRPLLLALIVIPLALALGSLAGYAVARAGSAETPYRAARLQAVSADLARIDGDYLLAAGDSHIERWPARTLCGLPLVNAGVSGATAASYASFLDEIALPRPPRAVILTLGTNDANTRRFRDPDQAAARFGTAFRDLLATLTRKAGLVAVTGPPLLDANKAEGFSADAAARIASAAMAACRDAARCIVTSAFPAGLAEVDGVHFADYAAAYREIGEGVCAALGRAKRFAARIRHNADADAP
jgi:lysophospholipase L1-like esterase